jgi:hypothetical protein
MGRPKSAMSDAKAAEQFHSETLLKQAAANMGLLRSLRR